MGYRLLVIMTHNHAVKIQTTLIRDAMEALVIELTQTTKQAVNK
jgi:hypothetical protein